MKMYKYFLSLTFIFIMSCTTTSLTSEKNHELLLHYEKKIIIEPTGETEKIKILVLIPGDYSLRQEVINRSFSIEPDRLFVDEHNTDAEFILENVKEETEIRISSEIKIYKFDLSELLYKNKETISFIDIDLTNYLIKEPFIETDNKTLIKVAKDLVGENRNQTINNIYNFVLSHLDYGSYEPADIGASLAYKNKSGDCTEYADLFITLCRINNIPVRFIEGYTLTGNMNKHNWVEIYEDQLGWFPVDPTWGDTDKRTKLNNLRNNYIYLSFKRNDGILNNYHYETWQWWGDKILIDVKENITKR